MKTRGYVDLYLPRMWAYHIKIVIASAILDILFRALLGQELWNAGTVFLFFLLIIQLELFIWLGGKFFNDLSVTNAKAYVKQILIKLGLFFAVAFVLSIIIFLAATTVFYLIIGEDLSQLIPNFLQIESKGLLIGTGSGFLFGAIIFFYFQWLDALKREQKLREEKLIFQYETLKNQVNPHFLFNSLNTLSSLVSMDVEQSEQYIQKLSSIYRYVLENKDLDLVNLKKELDFVRDYFYLQQVRDDGKIDLKIHINDPGKYEILPISLQLLVENAFKHNIATRERPLKIVIELHEFNESVSVSNNFNPITKIESPSKLGLNNLSERNKLITGREIEIVQSDGEFRVNVPLRKITNESTDHRR
jgi:two-component system LytT family sensor kinase